MTGKDNLEELADKCSLLRSVIDRDTTLEETLKEYESEFYALSKRGASLLNLSDTQLEYDVINYQYKINEFIEMIDEVGCAEISMERLNILKHIQMERNRVMEKVYIAGAVLVGLGIVTMPLMPFIIEKAVDLGMDAEDYMRGTKVTFRYLRRKAREMDQRIRLHYIAKYLIEQPEFFKEVYTNMNEAEQKLAQKKLENMVELGALDMSITELEEFLKN